MIFVLIAIKFNTRSVVFFYFTYYHQCDRFSLAFIAGLMRFQKSSHIARKSRLRTFDDQKGSQM